MEFEVGRVIRSSTVRFAVGCQLLRPQVPAFGALVKAQTVSDLAVYGLIYDVRMEDDPFVRQVASFTDSQRPEIIEDMRNRQLPIEVGVLVVGHRTRAQLHHRLPPQPPLSLDLVRTCDRGELVEFTERFDYFQLVLDNRDLPADELLAAHLRYSAEARADTGREFLVRAGRELARLLALDLGRLDALLRRIRP